jgi:hypothetical protein
MIFKNRRFVIIPASKINNINFSEVLETSASTCRYSVDETKTLIKYEGDMPESVAAIEDKSQEYTYDEILKILDADWVNSLIEENI